MKNDRKQPYIRLKEGLAIRKVAQSKNWGIYLKLPNQKALQFSLKTSDQDIAIEKAWAEYTYAKALIDKGESPKQPQQRMTISQALAELVDVHEKLQSATKKKGREGKYATQVRIWKKIQQFIDPELQPKQLDASLIRSYMLEQAPYSNTQLVATRYCFVALFDFLIEKKLINKDDIVDVKKIKTEKQSLKRKDNLNLSEFTNLGIYSLKNIDRKNKKSEHTQKMAFFYMSFLYFSGVRAGFEALGIKWSDLEYSSYDDLYCTIRDGKTKDYRKNNRKVVFDILAEEIIYDVAIFKHGSVLTNNNRRFCLEEVIKRFPDEKIFSTLYSDNPTYPKIFKRWVEEAKIKKIINNDKLITLYSLRHSYITRALESNTPIPLIAENSGTSASMIEKHYSHVSVLAESSRQSLVRTKFMLEKNKRDDTYSKSDEDLLFKLAEDIFPTVKS